jgi:hypothetical protein
VNDDVAGVDQHPVTVGQAFDPRLAATGVLEGAQEVVGHGADVTVRAARGHDQTVGDRALVLEIDMDDVLRLIVVETGENQGFETFLARRSGGLAGAGTGRFGGGL